MIVFWIFVMVVALFGGLNVFTLLLPRQFLVQRQKFKNGERGQLAMSQGWQFAPYAPELLNQWGNIAPFNQRGDRRVAFGVIRGSLNGLEFTAFDYQRRTLTRSHNAIIFSEDNTVVTVWSVRLPVSLPYVEVAKRGFFNNTDQGQIPIPHRDFNRQYLVQGQNPQLVAELLTPQAVDLIIDAKLEGWTIIGADLVYYEDNKLTRNTPQEIMQKLEALKYLVGVIPQHVWEKYGTPAPPMPPLLSAQQPAMPQFPQQPQFQQQPQFPQQPAPQAQFAQPQFAPQQFPQQPSGGYAQPQQGYPMGQQQYPPQAYPQQQQFPPRY